MDGYQKMKRQLLPLIKGTPFVALTFIVGIFIARSIVKYTPNVYQSMAKIKLDDQKFGVSNNYMYKDFEMFSVEHQLEAEAELLKSPLIIGMALDSLSFHIQFSRMGQMKNTLLYKNAPFTAKYDVEDPSFEDQVLELHVLTNYSFFMNYPDSEKKIVGKFGKAISIKGGTITICRNERAIRQQLLDVIGNYEIQTFSKNTLIKNIVLNLDVIAIDKETPILRVVYKDENPEKVADFINTLCKTYIDDYVQSKSSAAKQTVDFIEEKLAAISTDLGHSETELESFKQTNDVVNTLQETETGLREISKLKIELINMEMNEKAMRQLEQYISSGNYFDETAINFGFGDLLMTELVKKLKVLYDERHDLTIKYTENSENVKSTDRKIAEIKKYIKEAIRQNLKEIAIKRADYSRVVNEESHMFDGLPTREKNQHVLERTFRINEDVYNFLTQKKIDASIMASSMISFHRIIQPAVISKEPVSPNKTLLTFVFGLFGLIIGIGFIYFRRFTRARVLSRDDVEKNCTIPFLGIVRNNGKESDFQMLIKNISIKHPDLKRCISINSTLSSEGKSYITEGLSLAFLQSGKRVCIIDMNSGNPSGKQPQFPLAQRDFKKIDSTTVVRLFMVENEILHATDIDELKTVFDIILIDTAATANEIRGIEAMRLADVVLFIVRANHTCINYLTEPDLIQQEYQISNMYMVMNGAHKATNYTGNYVGSRFDSTRKSTGVLGKLRYYYQLYF